ncbi:LysR family transcriptional regulator [Amycolatopsis thermophila]|uniref:DNA-binding transcriptional LysR family regulator n=1 Tax=Amycolatopsis thermophila TaxID=206084 RepID=A0ABU0EXM6_9PSEU|nr:LysR family transcriptional regulator [Amycolatopsis thermophila]MDQ0380023.1 DNA-binding transcriptional LysR family regulator [Amycolatopsis thermophila]
MELRQLRAFVAVASVGTVTGAAERLGLSPATVSEHVRSLEASLGLVLFERKPNGMVLGERGRLLLPEARRLLDQAESIRRLVSDERTRFAVGALETLVATRLPAVVARLGDRRPDLDLAVRSLMRQPLLQAVADGELDAGLLLDTGSALGTLGFDGGDLSFVDIETVRLFLVSKPGRTGDDVLLVTPDGCSFRMAADRLLGAHGRRLEFDSVSTIRAWVTQGLGIALLPDFAVASDLADGTLVSLPMADSAELALRVVWRTDREDDLRDVLYAMAA